MIPTKQEIIKLFFGMMVIMIGLYLGYYFPHTETPVWITLSVILVATGLLYLSFMITGRGVNDTNN